MCIRDRLRPLEARSLPSEAESLTRLPYWSKLGRVELRWLATWSRVELPSLEAGSRVELPSLGTSSRVELPSCATCVSASPPKRAGSKCRAGGGGNSSPLSFFQKASDGSVGSFGFPKSTDLQPKEIASPRHISKISVVFDAFNNIGTPVGINFNEPKVLWDTWLPIFIFHLKLASPSKSHSDLAESR